MTNPMADQPDCQHTYPRGSEYCGICGRYRHADAVKAVVAKAPPLSADQRARISALFRMSDVDLRAIERKTALKRIIAQHALVRYPVECACGARLQSRDAWAGHVGEAIVSMITGTPAKARQRRKTGSA
jgi:hypothetical protein